MYIQTKRRVLSHTKCLLTLKVIVVQLWSLVQQKPAVSGSGHSPGLPGCAVVTAADIKYAGVWEEPFAGL